MSPRKSNESGEIQCSKCRAWKPITNFGLRRSTRSGHVSHCKACQLAKRVKNREKADASARAYRVEHADRINAGRRADYAARPGAYRDRQLRSKYGFSHAQYEVMLHAQHGSCAICATTSPDNRYKKFHVDHDHKTGRIRGLLRNKCNVGLGSFKDNSELLTGAAAYLIRTAA